MDAAQFAALGQRLYGRHGWKSELADKLGLDRTTVWRYARGDRPVPESVRLALETLLTQQANA